MDCETDMAAAYDIAIKHTELEVDILVEPAGIE
jgi:hypothetical protein